MIRIGEFARMARVSVATLRLYDEMQLLRPSAVNEETGYRSYETSQLVDCHRIGVLKNLGFSLREIQGILNDRVSPEGMSERLDEKREAAEAQLQRAKYRMKQLELEIQIIRGLSSMTTENVKTLDTPEIEVASIHLVIPQNDQAGVLLGEAYDELFGAIHRQNLSPTGPCLALWWDDSNVVVGEQADAAVPIPPEFVPEGRMVRTTLPSVRVATVTHRGPFSEFQTCHIVLKEWLAQKQHRQSGPYRETYHSPPGDESIVEVQYPIAPL